MLGREDGIEVWRRGLPASGGRGGGVGVGGGIDPDPQPSSSPLFPASHLILGAAA